MTVLQRTTDLLEANSRLVDQITKFKRLEADKLLLAAAVESAAESIVITDVNTSIVYVNQAFEQISGYSREEVLGKRRES